jgi:hypothetical protein
MTYELAKQLKEAGWPQVFEYGARFYDGSYDDHWERIWIDGMLRERADKTCVVKPTLEQLIKACGKHLYELTNLEEEGWEAHSVIVFSQKGNTPDEAVARLWLAIFKPLNN